jgi:hypothetical protein
MRALVFLALCLAATPATAREVRVPLRLDFTFLRELLLARTFTDPERTARVYTDGVDCNRVTLREPALARAGERLRVTSRLDAKLGTLFLGYCLFPVEWQGTVAAQLEPRLDQRCRSCASRWSSRACRRRARRSRPRGCCATGSSATRGRGSSS